MVGQNFSKCVTAKFEFLESVHTQHLKIFREGVVFMKQQQKVIAPKLPCDVINAIRNVTGEQSVSEDRAIIETYSRFSVDTLGTIRKHLKDPTVLPACIVLPESTEQVQSIVRIANRFKVPVIPFTNGFVAVSGPPSSQPTICIHLSRMNKILEIDDRNMFARLQAFADYGQLQAETMKKGLWNGGTPLATSICKPASQASLAGVWQTDLKYGTLSKNIISTKVVLPTGEVLVTGSDVMPGVKSFWEYGPGPDLLSMIRGSGATAGIITEIVVKLHPWPGGTDFPEIPAGRPCIQDFYEAKYDSPPPPKRTKLLWAEFPDYASELAALAKAAQSGIGIGLNATGVYNAYYCSQTQDMTLECLKNKFFPPYNCYLVILGITSERQIEYEEKIFKEIIAEVGGMLLSETNKPEVLEALKPWNLDCLRHVTGFRMNRHYYGGSIVPLGPLKEIAYKTREVWANAINTIGETYITDRGGIEETPFLYALNRGGRYWLSEADVYPDPLDPEKLKRARMLTVSSNVHFVSQKLAPPVQGILIEPFVSGYPECGPNAYLLFRKFRKIFDPNGVCAPGRQVFTEEEFNALPDATFGFVNSMRTRHGMPPLQRNKT